MKLHVSFSRLHRTRRLAAAAVLAWPLHAASAQERAYAACGARLLPVILPGGARDDEARAATLLADRTWALARRSSDSARTLMRRDTTAARVRVGIVAPELLVTSQHSFPLPDNDGPMWAGRGRTVSLTTGIAACGRGGRWGVIVAPTWWRSENRDVPRVTDPQVVPPFKPGASPFSSPYHFEPRSIDMPRRFGDDPVSRVEPGLLGAWIATERVEVGITTEPEWWGPGLRNALLLSTQAAGVPRAYVRSVAPLRLAGELDVQLFLGRLSWSDYFRDPAPADSSRSLSGAMLVWRPWFDRRLQLGAARLVGAPVAGNNLLVHALDVVRDVGRPNAIGRTDSTALRGPDQLFSVFAHWQLPDDHTAAWLEWGRAEQPASPTDLLASPNHSRALTIGIQHVRPWTSRAGWSTRLAFEYTATNQTGTFRERPAGSWYTSRSLPGGFTHRGQVLGAFIGPGSVTQWGALDLATRRGSAGVFVQRIKWDDDSFYTIPRPLGNGLCKHDVTLAWGLRGVLRTLRFGEAEATVASQQRMNLYWQALGFCWANEELEVNARNVAVTFRWRPPVLP
ncbi:MAG: capsule assembly Wzi family protein [Gemmatimonadaceae bacterium]|nr:capsule assembly Wzi family protein [Gemmatimonadaceae bacterium]